MLSILQLIKTTIFENIFKLIKKKPIKTYKNNKKKLK